MQNIIGTMKKLYSLLILTLISISVFSQKNNAPKEDVLQKTNGEEMRGQVIKVSDSDVTFVYTGETAQYVINKKDVAKISHASGRIETFSPQNNQAQIRDKEEVDMSASPTDHHNKIAVLPFTYVLDNQPGAEAIGLKAQDDTNDYLSQHAQGYTILDSRTTNALLAKAGITGDKMMNFTMKEIGDILGAEYIVEGVVTQTKAYMSNYTSGRSSTDVKKDDDKSVKGVSSSGSTYSTSEQNYDMTVALGIYMDNNASIYKQTHKAFFSNTSGSYSGPLEYLLKRSPLYIK